MKRLSPLALIGALALASLTACSSDGGNIDDFCAVSDSLGADGGFEFEDLSDATMEQALAGDMTGVNEWGDSAVASIDSVSKKLETAKGGAPTDEVAQAIDDVSEALALMRTFAASASESSDLMELMTEAETLGTEFEEIDAKMTAAGDVLDAAEAEYCS